MQQYDVTVTVGSRPLVKAVLGMLDPVLAGVPGSYPLAVPGAVDSGLRVDAVTADVTGTGTALQLVVTIDAHLFGSVLGAAHTTVGFNALTDLTHLGAVQLPFGQLVPLPLGTAAGHDLAVTLTARVPLELHGPTAATDHELWLVPGMPTVTAAAPLDVAGVASFLAAAQTRIATILHTAFNAAASLTPPDPAAGGPLATILGDLQNGALTRITGVLSALPAVSLGRLTAPAAGTSCLTALVPTAGAARVQVHSATDFQLQIGLMLGTRTGGDTFAPATASSSTALDVQISNPALLALLCCMLQSLPTLMLPADHTTSADTDSPLCCTWHGATLNLGPFASTGVDVDLCIRSQPDGSKVIQVSGMVNQWLAAAASLSVTFDATLDVDLNHLGELTALKTPTVNATASLSQGFWFGTLLTTMPFIGPWVEGTALVLQAVVNGQLNALLQTVFQPLKTLSSAAVVPPGLLELFGGLTSQLVRLDDLEVEAVAWAPPGLRRHRFNVLPRPPHVPPEVPPVTTTPGGGPTVPPTPPVTPVPPKTTTTRARRAAKA
jgi:hypothetical protein